MLRKVIRIDADGLYVEDVLLKKGETTPNDCIDIPCPDGFYRPKWIGTQWVEGLTQEQIDALNNVPRLPATEERLASTESAILALMEVLNNV